MWINLTVPIGSVGANSILTAQIMIPDFNFTPDVIIYVDDCYIKTADETTYVKASIYVANRVGQSNSPLRVEIPEVR